MTISVLKQHILLVSAIIVFTVCSMPAAFSQVPSCTYACNDTVNVSVNRNCEAIITADMILEGYNFGACPTPVAPRIFDQNGRLINGVRLTRQYIGQYLKVEMSSPTRGTCWGYIKLEDKLPPQVICPPNDTLRCDETDYAANNASLESRLKTQLEASLVDNCDNESLQIVVISNVLSRECERQFNATRNITFIARDNHANADTCSFRILYEGVPPSEIDPPKNFTDNMSLECTTAFPLMNGRPYPTVKYLLDRFGGISIPNINGVGLANLVNGEFITNNVCNFKINYTDQVFQSCGPTYKIVRTWRVLDWCNNNIPFDFHQVIKVVDHNIDIVSCPSTIQLNTLTSCNMIGTLNRPQIAASECGTWTWSVAVKEAGKSEFVNIRTNISSSVASVTYTFPLGISMVRYTVVDDCGNEDSCIFNVVVTDNQEPMAVCDLRTVITLNDDFKAKVFAQSFDDGSFDACSDITYQVRRMDAGCDSVSVAFADFVKFCCEDLGKTIMVELRVTDENGLFSSCMAEALIQYKGQLLDITCRPNPAVMDCRRFNTFNPNTLAPPVVTTKNICIPVQNPVPSIENQNIDACGVGFKVVVWKINFNGRDSTICRQTVNFINQVPFDVNDIRWPSDRTITTCDNLDPTTSELNNLIPNSLQCANVIYSDPQDKVFDNLKESCIKVLRTWTVVDWCQYPANPNAIWTHVQTIKVVGSKAPVFNAGVANIGIETRANCQGQVNAVPVAEDDCTADNQLKWTYQLDLISGQSSINRIPKTNGKVINTLLDIGTYRATWTVEDKCANVTTAFKDFTIGDSEKPVILTKSYSTSISAATQTAVVRVADVNNNSRDNCDNSLQLGIRRSGTNDALAPSITMTCEDVGTLTIDLVGQDDAGNTNSNTAIVNLSDPSGACRQGFFGDAMPCGYVMDFDGVDDYISVPGLDITPEFTIEAMVYYEGSGDGYVTLFEFGNDNPFIGFDNGRPTIFGQIVDEEAFPLNIWTHIAFTYSPAANQSAIYINGVISKIGAATSSFIGEGFGIANLSGDGYFKGKLDEVRVWNVARNAADIASGMISTVDSRSPGLVGYYDFNAVAGNAIDKSVFALHGTLNGLTGPNAFPQFEKVDIACPPDNSGAVANSFISGKIYTPQLQSIEKAEISIQKMSSNEMSYKTSDVHGEYAFANLKAYEDYALKAQKSDDYTNGVSTLDLILIQLHILGIQTLDSPYKLIAADASNNGSISSIDLVLLKQLILGMIDKLPANDSWRFVEKGFVFDDLRNPWQFEEEMAVRLSGQRLIDRDFIGIKVGDVDGSAIANSALAGVRSSNTLQLGYENTFENGSWYVHVVAQQNISLSGLQMYLTNDVANVSDISSGKLIIDEQSFYTDHKNVALMWYDIEGIAIEKGDILFSVRLDAPLQTNPTVQLDIQKDGSHKVFDRDLRSYDIKWSPIEKTLTEESLVVYQNIPNPFSRTTDIYFDISDDTDVSIEIFSLNGQKVYSQKSLFPKGTNKININTAVTPLNKGIYYYQIKTVNRSLVRKMIVI